MQQSDRGEFREDYDFLVTRSQQLYKKNARQFCVKYDLSEGLKMGCYQMEVKSCNIF